MFKKSPNNSLQVRIYFGHPYLGMDLMHHGCCCCFFFYHFIATKLFFPVCTLLLSRHPNLCDVPGEKGPVLIFFLNIFLIKLFT